MKTKLYLDSIFIQFVNKRERSQSNEFAHLFIYYLFTAIGKKLPSFFYLGLHKLLKIERKKEGRKEAR